MQTGTIGVIHHLQHLDDALATDHPFAHAGVEAVAVEVVDAVHIQLAAHQLVQVAFGVLVAEDADAEVQCPAELEVQRIHHQGAHVLVADAFHQAMFQGMAEGPVPHIVQEDRDARTEGLFFGDHVPFAA